MTTTTATQHQTHDRHPASHSSGPGPRNGVFGPSHDQTQHVDRIKPRTQHLTILLDGITAGDYVTWLRDPEPHALGRELASLSMQAGPLDDHIDVLLVWNNDPPSPRAAATAAGFALTPEVIEVRTST
jgi:hypothetical protein